MPTLASRGIVIMVVRATVGDEPKLALPHEHVAPFVPLDKEVMSSPAWRAASYGARWLYMHLKRRWSFKQKNNGFLFLSHRVAMKEIGTPHRDSISRWFRELQHYGFIVQTAAGCLGVDGKGKAPRWRLTEVEALGGRNGNTWMLPTKDFNRWDGTRFRDDRGEVLRKRKGKQNPGPESEARVARKARPVLARKARPVDPAGGPESEAISEHEGGPESEARSRLTTRVGGWVSDAEDWPVSEGDENCTGPDYERWAANKRKKEQQLNEVAYEASPTKIRNLNLILWRLLDNDSDYARGEWGNRHFLTESEVEWLQGVDRERPKMGDYHEAQQIERRVCERRNKKWREQKADPHKQCGSAAEPDLFGNEQLCCWLRRIAAAMQHYRGASR
jgi:hypothetical protein